MCQNNLTIHSSNKTALLYGSSTPVGSYCLELLLNNPAYTSVKVISGQKPDLQSEKLDFILLNNNSLEDIKNQLKCDDLFLCPDSFLNHKEGSDSYVAENYLLPSQIAINSRKQGASQIVLLSSLMAIGSSYLLPLKVRADLEQTVKSLNFKATYIFKTSVVLPKPVKDSLGANLADTFATKLDSVSGGFISMVRPIEALDVATAMVNVPQQLLEGIHVIKNNQIHTFVKLKS